MGLIIDTPMNVKTFLPQLRRANVDAIIRYEARPPGGAWKRCQPDEAAAIGAAGLNLGLVYEGAGDHAGYFTRTSGRLDGEYAVNRKDVYGQPNGAATYFAVDYDASPSDLANHVIPYFEEIKRAFIGLNANLRVGCYGSGYTTNVLKDRGLIHLRWITCSLGFRGSRTAIRAGAYELWQTNCDKRLIGKDVDFNTANVPNWGQFVPFAAPPPAPSVPDREVA